mgnify:CR=1 FL=1
MKNKMKFKIGEFSKLCQVTVKTLRHYEEIGLMIPLKYEWTGYRYYDISQLRCMSRIVYLKQLGSASKRYPSCLPMARNFRMLNC